jgi:hypothetical protein
MSSPGEEAFDVFEKTLLPWGMVGPVTVQGFIESLQHLALLV